MITKNTWGQILSAAAPTYLNYSQKQPQNYEFISDIYQK